MAKNKYIEDERVIAAFLNNFRIVDIMSETGLSKLTVMKIRDDPEFQKVLQKRKDTIIRTAVNKMQSYLTKDVEILQGIIEDEETAAQTKVNAIQVLMNQLRDWTTTSDIMRRIESLENPISD